VEGGGLKVAVSRVDQLEAQNRSTCFSRTKTDERTMSLEDFSLGRYRNASPLSSYWMVVSPRRPIPEYKLRRWVSTGLGA